MNFKKYFTSKVLENLSQTTLKENEKKSDMENITLIDVTDWTENIAILNADDKYCWYNVDRLLILFVMFICFIIIGILSYIVVKLY